jgi:hypothetical protein
MPGDRSDRYKIQFAEEEAGFEEHRRGGKK